MASTALIAILFVLVRCVCSNTHVWCGQGERLNVSSMACVPCETNTFMDKYKHNNTQCLKCKLPEVYDKEVAISPCNSTHNTEIGCVSGYYRNDGDCDKCTDCLFNNTLTLRPCTPTRHAECGIHPDPTTDMPMSTTESPPRGTTGGKNASCTVGSDVTVIIMLICIHFAISHKF